MSAKCPKCPICHNEYFIVKDLLFTGMGPQGVLLGSKVYIPKCSNCGYQLDPCSSEEEVLLRIRGFATDILVYSLVMHKNLNKVTHHPKTITQEELEKRLKKAIEQGTKDFADVEDVTKYVEDTIACFFSSEIYGTEEAYKKASEAKE